MCLGRPVSHMSGKSCKAGGMSALPPCVYSVRDSVDYRLALAVEPLPL